MWQKEINLERSEWKELPSCNKVGRLKDVTELKWRESIPTNRSFGIWIFLETFEISFNQLKESHKLGLFHKWRHNFNEKEEFEMNHCFN